MFILDETLKLVRRQTVLCVGDVMLDDFVYGEVNRISPEAPVQVLTVTSSELVVGGAGNVARNVAALGARCVFVSVTGEDEAARTLQTALSAEPGIETSLVVDRSRPTTRKVRFVSEHHSTHLLRADWEQAKPIAGDVEQAVIDAALAALPRVSAIVLSDYAKGVLTPRVVRTLIDAARKAGKPLIVDPKGKDFSSYAGATLITPNSQELAEVSRHGVATDADVTAAVAELNRVVKSDAVLVTRGEQGMMLVQNGAGRSGPEFDLGAGAFGQGARCVRRRRHGGGGARRDGRRRHVVRRRDDGRQCRRRRGGRQAGHRDGLAAGAAGAHAAFRLAGA